MVDKRTIWQQALGGLAEDFFGLFLSPRQSFPDNVSYPVTPGMEALIDDRFDSLHIPEKHLLHLDELIDEAGMAVDNRKISDLIALFEWEILNGFSHEAAFTLDGPSFEGLRQLAGSWGARLAQTIDRAQRMCDICQVFGDVLVPIFSQLPAKELGEVIRESFTPSYLKAQASVEYAISLFLQNSRMLREAADVLQASDAHLSREIASAMSGMSSLDLGNQLKRVMTDLATCWRELFSSQDFRTKFIDTLPFAFKYIAWYIGYCFRLHLQNNPESVKRVLQRIERHEEVCAVMEQSEYIHGWEGDQNKAVELAWRSVAPKFFRISGSIEKISKDEDQERLIGIANALQYYCRENPAFVGLMDAASGGLGTYLARAGNNRGTSWYRKQHTKGNRALTDAEHPEATEILSTKQSAADQEAEELSDDEILSRLKERYHPSGDPVVQEVEAKGILVTWYKSLTPQEKTAVNLLAAELDTQEEIAEAMGISQQRVAQLLKQALEKHRRISQ